MWDGVLVTASGLLLVLFSMVLMACERFY